MAKGFAGFGLFSGLVVVIAACGGSALDEGGSSKAGAAGQSSGGAGAIAGGASTVAGSSAAGSSTAGSSTAGSSSNAAGSSSAGASAAGAASSDACSAPMVPGQCDAYMPSFWHDPQSGLCEPFVYGGCGGNDNRYPTRDACLTACPGGGSNWGACQVDADCTLTSAGCCEACEPVGDQDLLALNRANLAAQMNSPRCAAVGACAPCPTVSEQVATGKYFHPVCVAGQCSALDIRQSAETECNADTDCVLRDGVNCCAECDGGFVAVNSKTNFCPDGPQACSRCASIPPSDLRAACTSNRCMLASAP